jgi:hypothetical protein
LSIIVPTNLAEGDPQRIARRVAAAMRDHLALPSRAAIADNEPNRRTELQRLLKAGREGSLTATDLPHIRGGFLPSVTISFRKKLEGLGELKALTLFARSQPRSQLGDDELSEYLAEFEHDRRLIGYTVDPEGHTADLDITEAD